MRTFIVTELTAPVRRWQVGDFIFTIDEERGCFTADGSRYDTGFSGTHCWNSRGGRTLQQFLVGLSDSHYFLHKLFSRAQIYELDWPMTRRHILRDIIDGWRDGSISKADAHEAIDELRDLGEPSEDAIYQCRVLYRLFEGPIPGIRHRYTVRANRCWEAFQSFTKHLKEHP